MNTDLYAILGVSKTATPEEIKAAYRDLAVSLHPDKNPRGATLMQAVNEAYEVLGDLEKRKVYDRTGKVKPITSRANTCDGGAVPLPGTIDLTKLAQAFVPPHIYAAAGPSLERALQDRGIKPESASVESILECFGVLKPKRVRKRA